MVNSSHDTLFILRSEKFSTGTPLYIHICIRDVPHLLYIIGDCMCNYFQTYHQHYIDEAQKAKTVLPVSYIDPWPLDLLSALIG